MAARAGMATLITRVREMCNAGTADHTIDSTSYWTDDQIEDYLDERREDYYRVQLEMVEEINSGGSAIYQNYYLPDQARWVEQADGGTSIFRVYEGDGGDPGTANYTVYYEQRRIKFSSDTLGTTYYVDFSAYDLYSVAADIWERKAGLVWEDVDWSSDNHRVAAGKKHDYAMSKAKMFRNKRVRSVSRVRVDEV